MIFGEEDEFEDENTKVDHHRYISWLLGRDWKTETSRVDISGMYTSNHNNKWSS